MPSPTQRTLEALRKQGMTCAIVEKWNMHAKVRQDLFGFIDVLAMCGDSLTGVQCCASSGHAAHRDKIRAEPRAIEWLVGPGRSVELWSWRKLKVKRGGKAVRWTARVEDFWLQDGELISRERDDH